MQSVHEVIKEIMVYDERIHVKYNLNKIYVATYWERERDDG